MKHSSEQEHSSVMAGSDFDFMYMLSFDQVALHFYMVRGV